MHGEAALTASKFGTALEKFNQALSVDPADNQLVFRIKRAEEMQQKFEAKRAKQEEADRQRKEAAAAKFLLQKTRRKTYHNSHWDLTLSDVPQ